MMHFSVAGRCLVCTEEGACCFSAVRGLASVQVYDGDTSMEERPGARERARLLITNPDMLHQSFLPVHRQFADFLANLRHVIVDEGHYYRCGGRQNGWPVFVSGVSRWSSPPKRQAFQIYS